MKYDEQDCRLCGSKRCPVALHRPNFRIRRCPSCTTMWCDPLRLPEPEKPLRPEDDTIWDTYLSVDETIQRENAQRLELVQQLAPHSSHPRLLEIGCMHGDFVQQARSRGYDALGLDTSEPAVAWAAKNRPGLVQLGTLGSEQADASADVIAGFNVVEHMDDPGEFLDHVHRVLRPGGMFVAETPSQESIYHHVLFTRGRVMADRPGIDVGMHPGTHIFKFGRKAWNNVLTGRGFEMLENRAKSTPLRELLAKNEMRSMIVRAGIVGFGIAARLTGLGNRVLLAARR